MEGGKGPVGIGGWETEESPCNADHPPPPRGKMQKWQLSRGGIGFSGGKTRSSLLLLHLQVLQLPFPPYLC